ncbi:MAG: hypothetical protein NY202_02125 [Mollicutes bacterium UO1]
MSELIKNKIIYINKDMTIKRNDITDIESAKNLKYNGKDLVNSEKEIFNKLGSDPKLSLIQDTAELLEKVKEAQEATEFKRTLFNELSAAKRTKKNIVDAINTNGGQFDKAVSHQITKKGISRENDSSERNKEFLEGKIADLEVEVLGLDKLIEEEQKLVDANENLVINHQNNIDEKTKEKETIEDFKKILEGGMLEVGRPLYRSSPFDLSQAKEHLKNLVEEENLFAESEAKM